MRAGSVIAGSFGITLVGGVLLLAALGGIALLVVFAPQADPEGVREALVDAHEDLELCAAGSSGGELTVTLALHRGQPRHVGITDATLSKPVADCIAETLVTRPWPQVSGSARVPVVLAR